MWERPEDVKQGAERSSFSFFVPIDTLSLGNESHSAGCNLCFTGLGGLGITGSPWDPNFADTKPGGGWWIFSGLKNPEHKSSGRDFKLQVQSLRFQIRWKNLKPEKIGLRAKFNRHIHVLVIPKFREHNRSQKGRSALGSIQYKNTIILLGHGLYKI